MSKRSAMMHRQLQATSLGPKLWHCFVVLGVHVGCLELGAYLPTMLGPGPGKPCPYMPS